MCIRNRVVIEILYIILNFSMKRAKFLANILRLLSIVLFSHILALCVIIVIEHKIKRVKRGKVDYKWKKKQPLKKKKKKPLKQKKKKKLKPYKSKKVSPKKRKKKVIHRCAYSYSSFFAVLTFLNLTINVTIGKKKKSYTYALK